MENSKLRIGVLFGGLSSEKEVSLATGRYVYSLIDRQKYTAIPIYLSQNRKFYNIPDKLVIQNKTEDIENKLSEAVEMSLEDIKENIDVAFIALLGKYGEDGVIQGILELLNIPYTGSGILSSSVIMQKRVTKKILASLDIKTPNDIVLEKGQWDSEKEKDCLLDKIISEISLPCIVKPTREGSSIGVSCAKNKEDLRKSINEAFNWDTEILVEQFIKGIEFMCVVIGNDEPVAMLPTEVEFEGDIFTYEGKYMPGKARYYTPPRNVTSETIQKLRNIAVKAYKALGIKGYGRVDGFIIGDEIYVNELHTGTIMVPSSYVFQQAARADFSIGKIKAGLKGGSKLNIKGQSGLSPRTLISTIIDLAIDAHNKKKGTLQ